MAESLACRYLDLCDRHFMLCSKDRRNLQWSSIGMPSALAQLSEEQCNRAFPLSHVKPMVSVPSNVVWLRCAHGRPAVRGKQRSVVGRRLRTVSRNERAGSTDLARQRAYARICAVF